jgi:hypothetical protein
MSVRFDAAGDYLIRTASLPDMNAAYTWMAWVILDDSISDYRCLFSLYDQYGEYYDYIGTWDDGSTVLFEAFAPSAPYWVDIGTGTLGTGTWHHVAVTRNGAAMAIYLDGAAAGSSSAMSVASRAAATEMRGGDWRPATAPMGGRLDSIKLWTAALTQAEIQAEMQVKRPVRGLNLYNWAPTFPGASERYLDYSGNGYNWTEAGTLTDGDPPPVSWGGWSIFDKMVVAAGGNAEVSAVAGTATAAGVAPSAGGNAGISGATGAAAAAGLAPSVSGHAATAGVTATADAAGMAPGVGVAAQVTATAGAAAAEAVAPSLSGHAAIAAAAAAADVAASAPVVSGAGTAEVAAVAATAAAAGLAPSISVHAQVAAVAGTANAVGAAPALMATSTVMAMVGGASAAGVAPAVWIVLGIVALSLQARSTGLTLRGREIDLTVGLRPLALTVGGRG